MNTTRRLDRLEDSLTRFVPYPEPVYWTWLEMQTDDDLDVLARMAEHVKATGSLDGLPPADMDVIERLQRSLDDFAATSE